MVSTRLQLIGVAHGLVAVVATIHNSGSLVVRVHCRRHSTITAIVPKSAAACHVFGREVNLLGALAGNADSVRHRLNGSECPARSAIRLIPDFFQAWAALCAAVCAPVELFGKVHSRLLGLERQESSVVQVLQRSHQDLCLSQRRSREADVLPGRPCSALRRVHGIDQLLGHCLLLQGFLIHQLPMALPTRQLCGAEHQSRRCN
mmetsp:Transcript_45018/g.84018  ORF Transcript_45018/g.84018 Transcript_45018/m.84018 type:complete len:204 (-) Transcript_45018:72-683(-)